MQENTRIMPAEFEYLAPRTIGEALDMLESHDQVKVLAGGTDLIVKLKTGANIPVAYMMYIKDIEEMNYVREMDGHVRIGAVTPLSTIEKNEIVARKLPALHEALHAMAAIAVRNMATIGGNLCNSSPAGDTIPPLTVYGAEVVLTSRRGERQLPVDEFITGPGRNVLASDELLTEVIVPLPKDGSGAAFQKKTRVKADISKINVAISLNREGGLVKDCCIALGSVGPTVVRAPQAEESLKGKAFSEKALREAAQMVAAGIKPIDDNRSTAEYRKEIAMVIVEDTLKKAWQRSGGELAND